LTGPVDRDEDIEGSGGVGDAENPDWFVAMVRIWFNRQQKSPAIAGRARLKVG